MLTVLPVVVLSVVPVVVLTEDVLADVAVAGVVDVPFTDICLDFVFELLVSLLQNFRISLQMSDEHLIRQMMSRRVLTKLVL